MTAKKSAGRAVKERREPPVEELSFEDAFSELETVVARLEGDGLTLEQSLALYERGQLLAARCGAQLDLAELRVQQLNQGGLAPLRLDGRVGDDDA